MQTVPGTTPPGATTEHQAARWVQQMFAGIAPKYDLVNHLLSFNIDRRWRRVLLQSLEPVLRQRNTKVLDLCCGTGDVLLEFQSVAATHILGADFCHPMLVAAQAKAAKQGFRAPLFEADALDLPLADESLEAVAISFGFRNLANYAQGLRELHRVLKPGGVLAVLEFSHPRNVFMKIGYGFYSRIFLPVIGSLVSGSREAYTYLPDSIRKFPAAEELARMMHSAGFPDVSVRSLTGGIAALHVARKSTT